MTQNMDVGQGKRSLLRIKLAPAKGVGRWRKFVNYLIDCSKSPEGAAATQKVEDIIDKSVEGGVAKLNQPAVANKKIEAETRNILQQTQSTEDDNHRKNSMFEAELRAKELENQRKEVEIQVRKAEAIGVGVESASKLLAFLKSNGVKGGVTLMPDGTPQIVMLDSRSEPAMFALGSVKTLDEYLEQARLPEVFGVPARVVEVLERRIGRAPLSVGGIAEELDLSKRTLQCRLQQQDVSFADLRDQVRFHYSIDYLIKQHLSIDSISASLDFSDRTSFTNAFKRWTGLSPSTFRKLFFEYA